MINDYSETKIIDNNNLENEFLIFKIKDFLFCIPAFEVDEIIKPIEITKVPKTPDYFEGIINLRGDVISIINSGIRLNLDRVSISEESRFIIFEIHGVKSGIVVDKVETVVELNKLLNVDFTKYDNSVFQKYIADVCIFPEKRENEIFLINIEKVIIDSDYFKKNGIKSNLHKKLSSNSKNTNEYKVENKIPYLYFELKKDYYCIKINSAEEVLNFPEITSAPDLPEFIIGMFFWRDILIPVIDINKRLAFDKVDSSVSMLVVQIEGFYCGIPLPNYPEMIYLDEHKIKPPPKNKNKNKLQSISGVFSINFNSKNNMFLVLDTKELFYSSELDSLKTFGNTQKIENSVTTLNELVSHLIFKTGCEYFALPLMEIEEILGQLKVIKVPDAPIFVEGIVNIRGEILCMIDLNKRLGINTGKNNTSSLNIVLTIKNIKTVLQVDEIIGIWHSSDNEIQNPPENITDEGISFIKGVLRDKIHNRMLIILNHQELLSSDESLIYKSLDFQM